MATQPPPLPPSALAGATAKANMDQIAVRIITLPESARGSQSTKISGTVAGQNSDGTLKIKTDKGELQILLRDKGNLPEGLKIEIEIPAGKNPQQANIRPEREGQQRDWTTSQPSAQQSPSAQTSDKTQPSLARTLQQQEQPSAPRPAQSITNQAVTAETIQAQIKVQAENLPALLKQAAPLLASGTLQAGQIIRLLPIPPNSLSPKILNSLLKPIGTPQLISNLVDLIEELPKTQTQLRMQLISLLSRLDFSSLRSSLSIASQAGPSGVQSGIATPTSPLSTTPVTPQLAGTPPNEAPTPLTPYKALQSKIDTLLQSVGLPTAFKPSQPALSPLQPAPTSLSLFNPSKSIDGQVLALPTQSPPLSVTTTTALTPSTLSVASENKNSTLFQSSPVTPSQVLGATQDGRPILSVPLPQSGLTQLYTLQFKVENLTSGDPVFIALDPTSTKPTQAVFIQSPDGSISLDQNLSKTSLTGWINSGTWDSFDDLLQTLSHNSPHHAEAFRNILPNPVQPSGMAALSMFFLSAMRSGESDQWLGNEAITLLRQLGKSESIRAASADIMLGARVENIFLAQDWRMTLLPLLWENQVHKLPGYYKHMPDEKENQEAEDKKRRRLRFLFDLSLSRMGGVQVDGFMQSERLDIILRTKAPLSVPMQTQMKRIYAGAMDKSRLTGDLSFQFKPEQWVDFSQNQGVPDEKSGLHA